MLNKKIIYLAIISTISLLIVACSSQEYTTAKLAIQQSDFAKAEEFLPKAMAIEPDNPEIPIVMGVEIYAKDGDWINMVAMYNKAMEINPEKVVEIRGAFISVKDAVNNYTEFYWAKEFNIGVEQFKKIKNDPDNKPAYLETAIQHFSNAALINPTDANTHATLAKCYFDLGDKDLAVKAALTAVEINPDNFEANFSAGQILVRAGLTSEEVLPYYEKAASLEPSNSKVLRELAGMYYDLGQKEQSIEVFENAISNEEDNIVKSNLFYNLGVIHNQMQNYEGAEKSFDEAFYLNDEDYEALEGMVHIYDSLGDQYLEGSNGFEKDLNEAYRWYRKAEKKIKDALIINPDEADKYKKILKQLRYKKGIAEGN
ncbi:MAG: tetratricopeptide repeat protein [Candidatus Marinimicrobia bacterium]|jgi:tetratricopeptide (TPR) repeat protein|nr:tetratricopeptide repeat protein [Candidatus Neomarinimicrobiota bacterium]MBT3500706.1 tetratricopeptide repeat protein [Candidatus Neomarinimicrobiota bacterium]MBT3839554.1 tetratricopeptide repeat protein [Candidatus Neomarinimicrobiota bacterium]MBT3998916.1 tetratricopeptide repeat protein [Candidatus Neomarinimicrobiota bacterium]MBT4283143.1 tetratricopeptide repeat protein [Candidatus Neomarinimicrobiota bacterium]